MDFDIEPNLLECDIAEGSYNLGRKQPSKGHDERKLLFRTSKEDSFNGTLQFSKPLEDLDNCQQRCKCVKCHRASKYYCGSCRIPLPCTEEIIPRVDFPVAIDIIKDIRENDGRSTAVHAKVIGKDYVTIYDQPGHMIPDYSKSSGETFLVFPDDDAISISEAFPKDSNPENPPRIVFIDATWKQARQLARSTNLSHLPRIKLSKQIRTLYWRYQNGETDSNLATIEAIYHFMVDFHKQTINHTYEGNYDDILYLFAFFYHKIHKLHGNMNEVNEALSIEELK